MSARLDSLIERLASFDQQLSSKASTDRLDRLSETLAFSRISLDNLAAKQADGEDKAGKDVDGLRDQLSSVSAAISNVENKMPSPEQVKALESRMNDVAAASELEALQEAFGKLSQRLDQETSASDEDVQAIKSQLAVAMKQVDEAAKEADMVALRRRLQRQVEAVSAIRKNKQDKSDSQTAKAVAELGAIEEKISILEQSVSLSQNSALNQLKDVTSKIDSLSRPKALGGSDLAETTRSLLRAGGANRSSFVRFNRALSGDAVKRLVSEWGPHLGLDLREQQLFYMADRICKVEADARGRLATNIEDAVLRCLVAMAVSGDHLDVLEIGTLFGVGAGMIHDIASPRFKSTQITLLDPLEGYYGEDTPDVLTGLPVNEAVLRENLRRMNVPNSDVTLVKHYSYDEEAKSQTRDKLFNLLVIDGDHSYKGVKIDFEGYHECIAKGGYVIFDDYGSEDWPDVKAYVDREMAGFPNFTQVGSDWRTAVFQRTT